MMRTQERRRPAIAPLLTFALALVTIAAPAVAQITPTTRSRFSRDADAEIQFQQGLLQYSQKQLKEAEANFQALVKQDPADAEAYYYLGLSQLDQGRPGESIPSFDQSLRLDPTSDEVRAARATALIRTAQYDKAEEDLRVLEADPRWDSLSAYLRGQLLYAKGDLEGAAPYFRKAKARGETEAAPAEFYEGLTYLRMKQLVKARSTFREASIGGRDPTVAAASRQLDDVLARQQRASKIWEVQISLGYEYDSNVILLGSDIATPAGISDESDSRFLLQPRASYSFIRGTKLEVGVETNGYFTWHNDLQDFNVASYQAGPFFNYRLGKNVYASARYGYNYIDFGHEKFLTRHIATPQLTLIEPKFGYTSAYYQYQGRDFYHQPNFAPFDRDGETHTAGIVQGITLPPIFSTAGESNLELSYRYEIQDTDGSDFEGDFHRVAATVYTPLPVLKLRGDVGVSVSFDQYDNPNSLDATGDTREDFEWSVSAGVTRQLTEAAALRVDYRFTDHDSNVTTPAGQLPYEYDRHLFGVRLIITF